jgi:hypothetical protein
MTIEQPSVVDFVHVTKTSGVIRLTIVDHLPWDQDEGEHLLLLQTKLNNYLEYIEGGQIRKNVPDANDRNVVINVIGDYALSEQASVFLERAGRAIEDLGFRLVFSLIHPASL